MRTKRSLPQYTLAAIWCLSALFPILLTAQQLHWAVPPQFDNYNYRNDTVHYVFEKDGHLGAINTEGKITVPFEYDIDPYTYGGVGYGQMIAKKNGFYGLVDSKTGAPLTPFVYDNLNMVWGNPNPQQPRILFTKKGKEGVLDAATHREIKPAMFESAYLDQENRYIVAQKRGLWGMYDWDGRLLIPHRYLQINVLAANAIAVQQALPGKMRGYIYNYEWQATKYEITKEPTIIPKRKWGLLNAQGKTVLPVAYAQINLLGEKHLSIVTAAEVDTSYYVHQLFLNGVARLDGQWVVAPDSMDVGYSIADGTFTCKKNGLFGAFDTTGRQILPFQYEVLQACSEGLFAAQRQGKWGFVDQKGNTVIDFKYKSVSEFINGLASACIADKKCSLIDRSGNPRFPMVYEGFDFQDSAHAIITRSDGDQSYWGLIDRNNGRTIVPTDYYTDYEDMPYGQVSEDMIFVCVQRGEEMLAGFYNRTGRLVVPPKYGCYETSGFQEGLACVYKNGKFGYIDKTGREVIPCVLESATSFINGFAAAKFGGKWGILKK